MKSNNEEGGRLPPESRSRTATGRMESAPLATFAGIRPLGKSRFSSMLQEATGALGPPRPAHLPSGECKVWLNELDYSLLELRVLAHQPPTAPTRQP